MYFIQYVYQYRCRLRYKDTKKAGPSFTRPTLIADLGPCDTYSGLLIRHTGSTLDTTLSVVLPFPDVGVMRDNTVVIQMDP